MFPRRSTIALLTLLATQVHAALEAPLSDCLGDPLPPRAVARLGSSRLRHGGSIQSLVFSPDGRKLASWGGEFLVSDGMALWEVATGRELRWVVKPGMWLNAWAWLPDGRLIAVLESKTNEQNCSLFDLNATNVKPQGLPPEDNGYQCRFAVSPTGGVLAVSRNGRDDRGYTLEFRDLRPGRPARELKVLRIGQGSLEYATGLSFTPDGRTLAAFTPPKGIPGDSRLTALLWDVATATERRRLFLPDMALAGLGDNDALSNERLVVGFADGGVCVFDLKTGKEERLPNRHQPDHPRPGHVLIGTAVCFTRDGNTLVTAGADRTIRFWSLADGKMIREFPWSKSRVVRLAVSPDGTRLAIGGREGVVCLLDSSTGAEYVAQLGHQSGVISVAVSSNGRIAATTGQDRTLRIWDLETARESRVITCDGSLRNCALAPDSKTVLAVVKREIGPVSRALRVWNTGDGQKTRMPGLTGTPTDWLQFAPNGRSLVTVSGDRVFVRSWPQGALLCGIALPHGPLASMGSILAISPDSKLLVTAVRFVNLLDDMVVDAAGGWTDLWDMTTGKHLRRLTESDPLRELAAFTAAGELVITNDSPLLGDQDRQKFPHGVVHVVDVGTGTLKRIFPSPRDVSALAISPDGRTAYLGSPEGTIEASDLVSGGIRLSLAGHHDGVTDLAIVPDGNRLVSTSRDGSALVWDLSAHPVNASDDLIRANK